MRGHAHDFNASSHSVAPVKVIAQVVWNRNKEQLFHSCLLYVISHQSHFQYNSSFIVFSNFLFILHEVR